MQRRNLERNIKKINSIGGRAIFDTFSTFVPFMLTKEKITETLALYFKF